MNACLKAKKVKGTQDKKEVKGWSIEEMKDKPNSLLDQDTEEMIKWRCLSQEEMDQCRKNLADKI